MNRPMEGAYYKHYCGEIFQILELGHMCHFPFTPVVIYKKCFKPVVWVREEKEWEEVVDGVSRFTRVQKPKGKVLFLLYILLKIIIEYDYEEKEEVPNGLEEEIT